MILPQSWQDEAKRFPVLARTVLLEAPGVPALAADAYIVGQSAYASGVDEDAALTFKEAWIGVRPAGGRGSSP